MFPYISLLATLLTPTITVLPTIPIVIEQRVEQVKEELLPEQVEWLNKLETCESNGSTTIRVLDVNGYYSYGRYQFQSKTFLTYGKKYGLVATSTDQAPPLIYDGDLQQKIAHKMLVDGGENHWENCTQVLQKLGKYPQ